MTQPPRFDPAQCDAVLFDLDGVLTPTALLHMRAWSDLFTSLFAEWELDQPYTDADYFAHLDGRQRYDGVAALLRSRDVEIAWGSPDDDPGENSVCGIGNRKNTVFARLLDEEGIAPYPGAVALLDALAKVAVPCAVVSSSKNARPVLAAAGLADRFSVVVDGILAEEQHLPSKPAPDVFLEGARLLGVEPTRAVVLEDATSGVAAGAAAGFSLVIGIDRGAGADALIAAGADIVVSDPGELLD